MWKWLHPYAKPERAYGLAGTLLPWFAVTSLLAFIIGTDPFNEAVGGNTQAARLDFRRPGCTRICEPGEGSADHGGDKHQCQSHQHFLILQ